MYVACVLSATVSVPELPETRDQVTGRFELNATIPPFCALVDDAFIVNPPLVITFWPVPDREMICGDPGAESTIEMAAVSDPTIEGVNETQIVQASPDDSTLPQFCEKLKSAAFFPVRTISEIDRNFVPLFINESGS